MKTTVISLFAFLEQVRQEPPKLSVEERIRHFASVYSQYSQNDAKKQTDRCLDCGNPYCQWKCPVHNYIPDWLKLAGEGKFLEAADLAHKTNTLPEVCGQVCPQESLCEGACTLNELGAVTIGAIENYLTEKAFEMGWKPDLSQVIPTQFRVAVIGAGPAGLACADRLVRKGIAATVYDKHPEIGGLLTFGIPEFKLEKKIIARRRKIFEEMGIQFILNKHFETEEQIHSLLADYDAVFLGLGADKGNQANIPGEDLAGIYPALSFLINNIKFSLGINTCELVELKDKTVLVLGAGDTAMDCSRTAIRMGAKSVSCIYRRDEKNRHGAKKDYKNAIEEGVNFIWQQQPIAFEGDQRVTAVTLARTEVDEQDNLIITNEMQSLAADVVIISYGFSVSPQSWFAACNIKTKDNGLVLINEFMQTSNEKIFAGGDLILGANLVVNAIAHGQLAAQSIFSYLTRI